MKSLTNKKIIIIIVIISLFLVIGLLLININNKKNDMLNEDYYIKFIGGYGEAIYTTYIYWDGGQDVEYIYSTSTTKSYGSSEWNEKTTKKGKFLFIQGMYDIAKENNSFSYAIINRDINLQQYNIDYKKGDKLTIDEVYSLFSVIGTK